MSGIHAEMKRRVESGIATCKDPRQAFIDELTRLGFNPPPSLRLGHIERFASPNDKPHGKAGWAVYYEIEQSGIDGHAIGVGTYGSFNSFPEKEYWSSKSVNSMNEKERFSYNEKIRQAQDQRELEIKISQDNASRKAFEKYSLMSPATGQEPYLLSKGISPSKGVMVTYDKYECGEVVIPICLDDKIMSLQNILNEGEYLINNEPIGNKKMMAGGRKQGCYFKIQGNDDKIYICEGYATGKTIHDATGHTVYVCFDSGNMYEVSSVALNQNPNSKVIICGDDDKWKKDNAGRKKAIQASEGLGIECVFPVFHDEATKPTDFNDLYILEGIDAVRNQILNPVKLYKKPDQINGSRKTSGKLSLEELTRPSGILGDIVNYYNATDGNTQPLFAVQSALATCSVILARNFESNFSNRSSIYLMNLGKSTTGKEHGKNVIERVLLACGKDDLISGEGYTSASGVLSALMDKPRHIAIIDEFAKYIHAAQNKNSSGHLMEANAYLTQSYSKLNGTMRPRSFATLQLTQEKKKQMANMKVTNPAITLLGIAPPQDFFQTIDASALSDGFLNRFIVCVSDAKRIIRRHKEPMPVPQNIIDWSDVISSRIPTTLECPVDAPATEVLNFTSDAVEEQEKFQQFAIDEADLLEKWNMDTMTGRLNENAMRLALIHALSKNPYTDIIDIDDMIWGIEWVKYNYQIVIDKIKMSVSNSEHEGHKKEVLQAIRDIGSKGITWSQMQKQTPYSKHKQKDLREILTALIDGDLIYEDVMNNGKAGRPSKLYKALA